MSDINANLVLNAGSANYGVVTKATVVNSGAANNGEITGTATFTGTAVNNGAVTVATFQDSAVNSSLAVAYTASFSGSASNSGAAVAASFTDSAVNTGAVVASGEFSGSASNTGTAAAAVFSGTASNSGTVQTAVFSDSASNAGTVSSVVVFTGNAVNTGTVAQAIFSGSAVNQGTVTASATFQDSASNSATGAIQGDAVFADTTSNAGSVAGTASVAATATNTGTAGTVVEYIQPNGYFSNGYFSGGSAGVSATRTAPENYATIVHSVGGVWYKYDNAGSASLAAGNYDDGSGTTYVFVSGIRKSIYNPPAYWYSDSSSAHHAVTLNGSVTQSDEGNGVVAALFEGSELKYAANDVIGNQDFTFELFVKTTNATPGFRDDMFSQNADGDTSKYGGFEIFKDAGGHINLGSFDVSVDLVSNATIADTNWHHIAVVGVGGQVSLYIDGIKDSTMSKEYTGTGSYNVGFSEYGPVNFYGKITGLRMIIGSALYSGDSFTVPTTLPTDISGTQLLLNFGATAAPTVTAPSTWYSDESSAHHAVTLNGTVTQSDEGGGVVAANFDGSSWLSVADSIGIASGEFTIEAFVKLNSLSPSTGREFTFIGQQSGQISFFADPDGNLGFGPYTVANDLTDNGVLTQTDIWHHLAISRSGTTTQMFIDGVLVATTEQTRDFGLGSLLIGSSPSSQNLNGKIIGLRIVQGQGLYTSDFAVPTTLPTDIGGTQLLLNFGATNAPAVAGGQGGGHADGYFSDGYYSGGVLVAGDGTVHEAQDQAGHWYQYMPTPGQANSVDNGPFSVGYFSNSVMVGGDGGTYQANDDGTWYTYGSTPGDVKSWYSDRSSATRTVTLNGSVARSDEGNGVVAAQFDGSTGYIKTSNSVTLGQTFTLEAFVYKLGNSNASGAAGDIFAQDAGGVQLNSEDNGTLWYSQFWVQNIASAFADLTGGWHHAVLVRNGTDVGVYVDGIKVISTTDNTDFGSSPIYIGGEPLANQFLNGKIAGVRVVAGTALYTSNFSVPTTLPTDISGTQLLLNFGATAAPTV
jgi:hypothetical protein